MTKANDPAEFKLGSMNPEWNPNKRSLSMNLYREIIRVPSKIKIFGGQQKPGRKHIHDY